MRHNGWIFVTILSLFIFFHSADAIAQVYSLNDIVINEIYYDVYLGSSGDANGNGTISESDDEFIEIVNKGTEPVNISSWQIKDDETGSGRTRFTFPDNTILQPNEFAVVFAETTGHQIPGRVFRASYMSLSNAGDVVWLINPNIPDTIEVRYEKAARKVLKSEFAGTTSDQSLTRSPDGSGEFKPHNQADAQSSKKFSPNRTIRGDRSLSVSLIYFEAQREGNLIKLYWITATEFKNLGFVIERSINDMDNFHVIADYTTHPRQLSSAGSSSNITEYSFEDGDIEFNGTYYYILSSVNYIGSVTRYLDFMDSVDVKLENFAYGLPFKVYLNQNYPNPFNDRTRISFQVTGYGGEEYLEVKIYSLLGREIATLFGDFMKAGEYSLYWNARNSKGIPVPSGSYVYSVIFNGKRISRKMTVLR